MLISSATYYRKQLNQMSPSPNPGRARQRAPTWFPIARCMTCGIPKPPPPLQTGTQVTRVTLGWRIGSARPALGSLKLGTELGTIVICGCGCGRPGQCPISLAQPECHQWAEPTCSEKHSGPEWLSALKALISTTIVSAPQPSCQGALIAIHGCFWLGGCFSGWEAAVLEFLMGTLRGGSEAQPVSHPGLRGLTWEGLAEHRLSRTWLPSISKTRKELSVSGISHLCCKVALNNTLTGAPAPTGRVSRTQLENKAVSGPRVLPCVALTAGKQRAEGRFPLCGTGSMSVWFP